MNTTLKYLAVITTFTAGGLAIAEGATLPGILAGVSGILIAVTIIRKEKPE